nr:hypothetical protein [uncultured bacterium]AIA16997.1 Unknown Function [uncultured bacterium]
MKAQFPHAVRSGWTVTDFFGGLSKHKAGLELYGLSTLLLTTVLWSILGSVIQASNADQLVDSYLFESSETFSGATFPIQHTFLLKWPVFWLQSLIGLNHLSFVLSTVFVVLATVIGLILLIRRIERRSSVRGLIYLGLSSVLLMTPTVPYSGALLPTNFAMLTTRNVEYLVYIFAVLLIIKSKSLGSRQFIGGTLILWVLFLSDGLFPPLSIGGAALVFAASFVYKKFSLRSFALKWLTAGIVAYGVSLIALKILAWVLPGRFNGDSSPYSFISTIHDAGLAILYAVLGLLTNYGANPVHESRTLSEIPHTFASEMMSGKFFGYLINILLFFLAVFAICMLLRLVFRQKQTGEERRIIIDSNMTILAVALIASSAVAFAIFNTTKHYYLVDSRYLTIFLFAGVITTALMFSTKQIPFKYVQIGAICLTLAVLSGVYASVTSYHDNKRVNTEISERNEMIATVLSRKKVDVLVGDYWRVLPIKLASQNQQKVMPLATCTVPRNVLTSSAWQPDLKSVSFAYLLSYDGSASDYPLCSLQDVTTAFGKPSYIEVIRGRAENPIEVLLLYNSTR